MRRLAIFVEGYTELLFLDRLVGEIATRKQVAIHHQQIRGGGASGKVPKNYIALNSPDPTQGESFYILICDCGGEDLVAARIREEHQPLTTKGYEKIIGLRDVFPKYKKSDIPKLLQGLRYGIRTKLAPVEFIMSVMEIEAWFLAEHNHFQLIDPAITTAAIQANLGFNPETDDMSDRPVPTNDMISVYDIGGKQYQKGAAVGTIDKIDYDYVYAVLRDRIPELGKLLTCIDLFLEPRN